MAFEMKLNDEPFQRLAEAHYDYYFPDGMK